MQFFFVGRDESKIHFEYNYSARQIRSINVLTYLSIIDFNDYYILGGFYHYHFILLTSYFLVYVS